jgi:ABC-type dipeptide/oligopeptide/nickel transport system permease component
MQLLGKILIVMLNLLVFGFLIVLFVGGIVGIVTAIYDSRTIEKYIHRAVQPGTMVERSTDFD